MAGYTKDELRSALVNHGVELPPVATKKDELVALYDEFVAGNGAGDFSSDDEASPKKVAAKKISRKSNGNNDSLIVGDVNIDELNDDELFDYMKKFDIPAGPIVDSTRKIYQRKLAAVMRGNLGEEPEKNGVEKNGDHTDKVLDQSIGEFSADEEAIGEESNKKDEDDVQPSVVIRKSSRKSTPKKIARESPLQAVGNSLRQRFGGKPDQDNSRDERFTPTPRRSIHSYKMTTETTKQTMVKSADGNVSHDLVYTKEISEADGTTNGRTAFSKALKILPVIFLGLIVVALVYYVGSKRT